MQNRPGFFKSRGTEHLTAFFALALVNLFVYRDYWFADKVFSGKDFLTCFHLLLNFQSDCLQQGSWPLWNPFMNFGYPYVDHYVNSALFPTHLLMGLTTGTTIWLIQRELLCWIILGGFGVYLCVRQNGLSAITGILAGASFMACGQIMALPQWSTLVYNAACFPFLILGYHRAKSGNTAFSPMTIISLALSILGGYVVSSVLGIYLFAGYVLLDAIISRKLNLAFRYLVATLTFAVLLTLPKLLPLYLGMGSGPRMGASAAIGPLDSFNIISPYNFLSLLLPVKFYFSLFLGTLAVLALIHGAINRQVRITPVLILTLISGWLLLCGSDGHESILRSAVSLLPFMKLVRNDWLSWYYPSTFAIIAFAPYIESYLLQSSLLTRGMTLFLYLAVLCGTFFTAYSTKLYWSACLIHLMVAAAWTFLGIMQKRQIFYGVAAICLVALEFSIVLMRTNVDTPPLKEGEKITYTVVDQASVSRSYKDSNRVNSAFTATALQDQLRPGINDARQWPYLISGLGGAPGINFYPGQYGRFIDSMNLKRFSGWWYNTQERYDFIRLKESPQLAAMEGMPLYLLIDPLGMASAAPVSFDAVTCNSFDFTASLPHSATFQLHQFYDDRWKVYVDGVKSPIRKMNGYFLGVDLDGGGHRIHFDFSDRNFKFGVMVSGATLLAMLLLLSREKWLCLIRIKTRLPGQT